MKTKYAVYQLTKGENPKEYVVLSTTIWDTLDEAYKDLNGWKENLYNPRAKQGTATYELHDRMLYIPDVKKDGEVMKTIGAFSWFPLYYIDVYPNPYSHYKLRKVRGKGELYLLGVK